MSVVEESLDDELTKEEPEIAEVKDTRDYFWHKLIILGVFILALVVVLWLVLKK